MSDIGKKHAKESAGKLDILTIVETAPPKSYRVYLADGKSKYNKRTHRISKMSSLQTVVIPHDEGESQQAFFIMREGKLVDFNLVPIYKFPTFISGFMSNKGPEIPSLVSITNRFTKTQESAPHLNLVRIETNGDGTKLIAFERDLLDMSRDSVFVTSHSYHGPKQLVFKLDDIGLGKAVILSGGKLEIAPFTTLRTFSLAEASEQEVQDMVWHFISYHMGF